MFVNKVYITAILSALLVFVGATLANADTRSVFIGIEKLSEDELIDANLPTRLQTPVVVNAGEPAKVLEGASVGSELQTGETNSADLYLIEVVEMVNLEVKLESLTEDLDIQIQFESSQGLVSPNAESLNPDLEIDEVNQILQPGIYIIKVYPYIGVTEAEAFYNLSVRATETGRLSAPQAAPSLGSLSDGSVKLESELGIIRPSELPTVLTFEISEQLAGRDIIVRLKGLSSDVDMTVKSPDGNLIIANNSGASNEETVITGVAAGTFTVELNLYEGEFSSYQVTVEALKQE